MKNEMTTIWYVHGAHSTPATFTFIKDKLPTHRVVDIAYDTETPIETTIKTIVDKINEAGEPIVMIGHSLGGVISVEVGNRCKLVQKIFTISSPFGGSKAANILKMMAPSCQLYKDISTMNPLLVGLSTSVPTRSVVTTWGANALMKEPNDNVVTVASQMALTGAEFVQINKNHFEILMDETVVNHIKEFVFDIPFVRPVDSTIIQIEKVENPIQNLFKQFSIPSFFK